ncbi:hypothetical protein BS47DRAFT_1314950 [Hydnum rufescens UP504]|uniref:UBA domain-containing protein n=1 Tax=Hydnum rufescens UP504 TaxID=1448309 RepID=A0A9P6B3H6_9AGAM|nr:hypothetical protein BS47DRAFT_1314950 [Hydnum rufescens UP504]
MDPHSLLEGRSRPSYYHSPLLTPVSRPASGATSSSMPITTLDLPTKEAWADFDVLVPSTADVEVKSPIPARPFASPTGNNPNLFDFASFDEPAVPPASSRSPPPPLRSETPGDFDFGDREYRDTLLNEADDHDEPDDDILGDLARPVESVVRRPSPATNVSASSSNGRTRQPVNERASPPPHIVGQIVEMGFSPQEAREALAATDTGVDVQAALDALLDGAQPSSTSPNRNARRPENARRDREEGLDHPRRPRAGPSRPPAVPAASASSDPGSSTALSPAQLKEQADKVLLHASEIGMNVFNRANAFWSQGKAQLQKVYDDRKVVSAPDGSEPRNRPNARPRWATTSPLEDGLDSSRSRFRDEIEQPEEGLPRPPLRTTKQLSEPQGLWSNQTFLIPNEPVTYVSPNRRRSAREPERPANPSTTLASAPENLFATHAPRHPSPPSLRKRALVGTPTSTLSASKSHRVKGTESYKLGRFAEAESAYTSAISLLPSNHLALVPLLNNRAAARLKVGDHAGAVADCGAVIGIIGEGFHPAKEEAIPPLEDGEVINLEDGFVRALHRRAEAYESTEKWSKARDDWEKLTTVDWPAGVRIRQEAMRGAARCRKMLSGDSGEVVTVQISRPQGASKPKHQPKSASLSRPTPPSDAVNRLRTANDTQEAEDLERIEIKDAVDAKLVAWKGGKENNLRALIASLDTVLWPELGWQTIGMSELITPGQVKIRYMKAIGRVHPDKLSSMNTTLEQRMIANGVFGALNEAWNTFKP